MQLFVTRTYERAIRKLISEEARKEMEAAIVADPDEAPVIGNWRHSQIAMGGFRPGQAGRHTDNLFYHSGPELSIC